MNVKLSGTSGIFRAYDIRGIYPDEINQENTKLIANATARFLNAKTLVIGEDVRISSETLRLAAIEGILDTGCNIIFIGQCTTPLFYFAVNSLKADGGIMVTASHNPPEYNGLKVVKTDSAPVGLDNGLAEIRRIASEGYFKNEDKGEKRDLLRIADEYLDFIIETSGLKGKKIKLRPVIDTSGGAASIVIQPLLDRLVIDYIPLNFKIDGTFSKDNPNPLAPHALDHVAKSILSNKADLGIVFDGDGDRMVVVDEKGGSVEAQFVLALMWQKIGGKVLHDLRFSRSVTELFGNDGVRSRVGHSHIASNMVYFGALTGGETSGHFFFKEMKGQESSALACLRFLDMLNSAGKPLSNLVSEMKKYHYSGEINLDFKGDFDEISSLIKEKYSDGLIEELDGISVDFWDKAKDGWWFNVRPSNTEPVVRLVLEAKTESLMEEKIKEITKIFS